MKIITVTTERCGAFLYENHSRFNNIPDRLGMKISKLIGEYHESYLNNHPEKNSLVSKVVTEAE